MIAKGVEIKFGIMNHKILGVFLILLHPKKNPCLIMPCPV